MSAGPIVFEISSLFVIVLFLLHKYSNFKQQNVITLVAVFFAWYFSFALIFLLPLDISLTTYHQCIQDHQSGKISNSTNDSAIIEVYCKKPWSLIPLIVFPVVWRIIYWSSQALTWLILPFMQSFSNSGEFTLKGKIKGALINNAIYYGTYLSLFGVFLIYVAVKHSIDGKNLKVIGVTASNTWGLFLLIILLGYGLVDVPRSLWNKSNTDLNLKQIYFKLAKLHGEKCDAEESLEDLLNEIKTIAENIRYNHPLRNYIDLIVKKCPENFRKNLQRNVEDFSEYNNNSSHSEIIEEKSLVNLHNRLIKLLQLNNRTNNLWMTMIREAFLVEDIKTNEFNSNKNFVRSIPLTYSYPILKNIWNPSVEWFYYCWIRKYMMKLLSIILMATTVIVIWSEMTFFNKKPVLSIFAVFLNRARNTYNYFSIELVGCLIIAYMCFCAYSTIFKIRLFNYYYLAPNHSTTEYSLVFSATLLSRLTSPLCYNFLGLVHLDSHITKDTDLIETQFTTIMGHLDVISFISDGFNIYFPILIFVFCLATFFNLGGRVLNFFGFEQFVGDTEITQDLIEDGKNLVKREKRKFQQNNQEFNLKISERVRDNFSSTATKYQTSNSLNRLASNDLKKIKEYKDIPSNSEDNDQNSLISSNKTRLFNDDQIDYESTTRKSQSFNQLSGSLNNTIKTKGIFDDV